MRRPSTSGTCNTCPSYCIDEGHRHSGQGALNGENDTEADGNGGEEVG